MNIVFLGEANHRTRYERKGTTTATRPYELLAATRLSQMRLIRAAGKMYETESINNLRAEINPARRSRMSGKEERGE
jgi:hypothetical protein